MLISIMKNVCKVIIFDEISVALIKPKKMLIAIASLAISKEVRPVDIKSAICVIHFIDLSTIIVMSMQVMLRVGCII